MNSGCEMEYVLKRGEKKVNDPFLGEKTSACVNGDTSSARNIHISLNCPF